MGVLYAQLYSQDNVLGQHYLRNYPMRERPPEPPCSTQKTGGGTGGKRPSGEPADDYVEAAARAPATSAEPQHTPHEYTA